MTEYRKKAPQLDGDDDARHAPVTRCHWTMTVETFRRRWPTLQERASKCPFFLASPGGIEQLSGVVAIGLVA